MARYFSEIQQASISLPVGLGLVVEFITAFLGREPAYFGLQEEVRARLCDKSKHRYHRPGQHACLLRNDFAPNWTTWSQRRQNKADRKDF
jgi:hypothetical protein